jgi:hypothetical protein
MFKIIAWEFLTAQEKPGRTLTCVHRSVVVKVMLELCALPRLQNPPELLLRPAAAAATPSRVVVRVAQVGSHRVSVVSIIADASAVAVAAARVSATVDGLVAAVVGGAVAVNVVVLPAPLLASRPER